MTLAEIREAVGKEFGLFMPHNVLLKCLSYHLLRYSLQRFFLRPRQFQIRVQRLLDASVDLRQLLLRKKALTLHQTGANCKILLGLPITVPEVMTLCHAGSVEGSAPSDKLHTVAVLILTAAEDNVLVLRQQLVP